MALLLIIVENLPKEHLVCITQDYLRRAKSAFKIDDYSSVFAPTPKFVMRNSLIVVQKP